MVVGQIAMSAGIGTASTGLYYVFTKDEREPHKDRRNECLCVFSIVAIVAFFTLFIVSGNSQSLAVRSSVAGTINTKPPF